MAVRGKEGRIIVGAFLICALVFIAGFRGASPSIQSAAQLQVDPSRLNFGEALEEREARWTFPVTNPGRAIVRASNFDRDCVCVELTPAQFELKPRETQSLTAVMDLRVNDWKAGELTRSRSIRLAPLLEGQRDQTLNPPTWRLTGVIRRNPIHFQEERLAFPPPLLQGQVYPELQMPLSVLDLDLSDWAVHCHPPHSAVVRLLPGPDEDPVALAVIPAHDLAVGPFEFDIEVSAQCNSWNQRVSRRLSVRGRIESDVALRPEGVEFGVATLHQELQLGVIASSRSGRRIRLSSIEKDDPALEVQVSSSEPANAQSLVVVQKFTQAGDATNVVRLQFEREVEELAGVFEPLPAVSLPVKYFGQFPSTED